MKRCSTSLVTKETQIKITTREHFTPSKMAITKTTDNNKCCQGCGETGTPTHGWWKWKRCSLFEEQVWQLPKWLTIVTISCSYSSWLPGWSFTHTWLLKRPTGYQTKSASSGLHSALPLSKAICSLTPDPLKCFHPLKHWFLLFMSSSLTDAKSSDFSPCFLQSSSSTSVGCIPVQESSSCYNRAQKASLFPPRSNQPPPERGTNFTVDKDISILYIS